MAKQKRTAWDKFDELCQRDGKPPVIETASYFRAAVKDKEKRQLEFVLCTPGIKRDGIEIVQKGWELDEFEQRGSLVFFGHATNVGSGGGFFGGGVVDPEKTIPVGKAPRTWLGGGGRVPTHLRGINEFLTEDKNPFAERLFRMYMDGDMRCVSVGFRPAVDTKTGKYAIEAIAPEDMKDADVAPWVKEMGGRRFLRTKLVEWSLVPLGMDQKAVAARVASGDLTPEMVDAMTVKPHENELRNMYGDSVLVLDGHAAKEEDAKLYVDMHVEPDASDAPIPEAIATITYIGPATGAPPTINAVEEIVRLAGHLGVTLDEFDRGAVPFSAHPMSMPMMDKKAPWDGSAARKNMEKWASTDGSGKMDKMNRNKLRQGFGIVKGDGALKGDYMFPHHNIVDGAMKVQPRGVYAAAQRAQQGNAKVTAVEAQGNKEHLGKHYKQMGEKAPWDRSEGQLYEEIHRKLADCQEEERDTLRGMATKLAERVYGELRLREPWEVGKLPEGNDSAWASIRCTLVDVVGDDGEEDSEDRDARVDNAVAEIARQLDTTLANAQWAVESMDKVSVALGETTPSCGSTEDVDRIVKRIVELKTPIVAKTEPVGPPTVDIGADVQARLDAIAASNRDLKAKATGGRSMLEEILTMGRLPK